MAIPKFLTYSWWMGEHKNTEKQLGALSLNEERAIKQQIAKILNKKGVVVSMAPNSKKYFIIHKEIGVNILINGNAELVKMSNHDWKYAWKFTNSFINSLIDMVIDKIEADRFQLENQIFENELNLINKIGGLIDNLEDSEKKVEYNLEK